VRCFVTAAVRPLGRASQPGRLPTSMARVWQQGLILRAAQQPPFTTVPRAWAQEATSSVQARINVFPITVLELKVQGKLPLKALPYTVHTVT
jgi:hypothetical protein